MPSRNSPVDPFAPAHRLAALVRARKIGCLELLNVYLTRVERFNPQLKAISVLDVERARARARAADRALSRNEIWGPLHGVPMTVKESFDVAGLPTTWGLPRLRANVPAANALAVDRLLAAGAVVFGKTNVPALLADWQTFNPIYGTTSNPWDVTRTPGGSSGGSAAALAAGLTALECGSDIGASIRNPAHYCGVFGHKPTFGICATTGQSLPPFLCESDISVIGPLARCAKDLAIALRAIAGPDRRAGRAWSLRLPPSPRRSWRQWRVAVMANAKIADVDRTVQDRIQAVADFAARQGARVDDRARPAIDLREANRVYISLLRAATSRSQDDAQFASQTERAAAVRPGDDTYPSLMLTGATASHRAWLLLDEARHRMREKWAAFFEDYDVLLCPAAATAAFPHNQRGERWERMIDVDGRPQPSTTQLFWAGFPGVAYLPSTVAPAGRTDGGLPVGVQIVGPEYGDLTTIAFARLLERSFQAFVAPPGYS